MQPMWVKPICFCKQEKGNGFSLCVKAGCIVVAITPKIASNFDTGLFIADAEKESQPTLTWGFELDGNRCYGKKDKVDAIIQSIFCILGTEKGAYIIYPASYGLQMDDLYGKPAPYMYAVLCDRIREALLMDDRIMAVDGFSYQASGDVMTIRFSVHIGYSDEDIISGVLYVR